HQAALRPERPGGRRGPRDQVAEDRSDTDLPQRQGGSHRGNRRGPRHRGRKDLRASAEGNNRDTASGLSPRIGTRVCYDPDCPVATMSVPLLRSIVATVFVVLIINTGYIAPFKSPTIFYMGNVMLHL